MWWAGSETAGGTSVLYMDCEGFGSSEADKTRDAKLMSLCLLISSVFLLNTKGVLNEGLFNALSLVCRMAEHTEQGSDSNKPVLLWLLRDFVLELKDESGRPLTPDEYLEHSLRARPLAAAEEERSRAAAEVRECLMKFFPERHCATLVQPVIEEEKLRRLQEVSYPELREEFRRPFEAMQAQLLSIARLRPKTVGGHPMSAGALVGLVRRLVDALNADNTLNVGNAWDMVQHNACNKLVSELREAALLETRKVREGGPLPAPAGQPLPVQDNLLSAALKDGRRALRQAWDETAIGDENVRAEYWKELKESVVAEQKSLEQLNVELSEQQLRNAGKDWEAWLSQETDAVAADPRSEALMLLLDKGTAYRPTVRVVRDVLSLARMSRIRFDSSQNALKAELRLVSEDLTSKNVAADVGTRVDDSQLEQTREVGRLKGQVDQLQNQAREAIQREKELREQALESEESLRKEQRVSAEASKRNAEFEQKIRELEAQVSMAKREVERGQMETELNGGYNGKGRRGKDPKPRCTCNVM